MFIFQLRQTWYLTAHCNGVATQLRDFTMGNSNFRGGFFPTPKQLVLHRSQSDVPLLFPSCSMHPLPLSWLLFPNFPVFPGLLFLGCLQLLRCRLPLSMRAADTRELAPYHRYSIIYWVSGC